MSENGESVERPTKRQKLSPDASNDLNNIPSDRPDQKEFEVGIRDFVSDGSILFHALLKKRYTDFLVNEVLPNGDVVHLMTTAVPKKFHNSDTGQDKQNTSDQTLSRNGGASKSSDKPTVNETETSSQVVESGEISEEDRSQLVTYLNETAVAELLTLYKAVLANPTRHPKDHAVVQTEFTNDRSLRAEIHGAIRRIFSSKIDSSTDHKGFLCLTAANPKSRRSAKPQSNGRPANHPGKLDWLERGGPYLHFTLCKENKDTMEAVSFLVRQLNISPKVFQFAGTKDRRAVTSQRVSAYRVDAERLVKQNNYLRNAAVGDFEYKPAGLELGDLEGNEFVLTLRECESSALSGLSMDDKLTKIRLSLDEALANLHTKGFLNYFGLQRFGTFSTRTDTVGLHILSDNFRAACEAILVYDPTVLTAAADAVEHPGEEASANNSASTVHTGPGRDEVHRAQAIEMFQKTANSHKPLEILPKKFSAENQIIRHLSRSPTDYIGALLAIPRNLRLIYVHAYQSLVWNHAATNRWRLFGSIVIEGDLVMVNEHKDKEQQTDSSSTTMFDSNGIGVDADGEIVLAPSAHDRSNRVDDVFERARRLTASEAASGLYSIFDIVLPLPGYDILYPTNKSGEFYAEFMGDRDHGGGLDPYDMRRKHKDFSLSGSYRKLMARIAQGHSVEVHPYARDEEQFVTTDLERVNKGQQQQQQQQTQAVEGEEKDKIAAVLKFQLGASQYATMALRELSHGGIITYKADGGSGGGK